jgi:primosomal protein N'
MLGGGSDDIRRRERLAIQWRRLASHVSQANGELLIQSDEAHATQWSAWLTEEGYRLFRDQELAERQLFHYPPAARVVKILRDGTEEDADALLHTIQGAAQKWQPVIRGPFAVPHRARSRKTRFVGHLIFPVSIPESELLTLLTPFASSTIIDIDPIAFLR